jgi:hypothetical protein
MTKDVMLGTLRLNLTATRNGVTISYYDQDRRHHRGLQKVKIGFLTPDEIRSGSAETAIDITPILPIAGEMMDEVSRRQQGGSAAA